MARILTVEQVAEKLQVKPLTVREYLRKGKIPGRKLGRSWRVVETDLEWFLSGKPSTPTVERISALGICADIPGFSAEAFMKSKRKEVELEEAKLQRAAGAA
ncbi:MAG: helix-turn-helix domain-containing protein [Armatimonadetes bacterium]|nr:helix-turn-helix domain-containing protein [Armatimonadota bacterium]